ncbi:MAG TPA: hypothetical protein VMJ10_18505 [Kofleriaceae bacterium]|nr:hypothetical protein [Kofleriaceae bacterium]
MRARLLVVVAAACGTGLPQPPAPGTVSVTVTSPAPGDELLASDQPAITVTGTATTTDPSYGRLQVWVDGAAVELDDSGNFTTQVVPTVGINHVEVDANDGLGDIASQQLDVMWAPDYLATLPSSANFEVNDALDLYLGQQFFDGQLLGTTLDMSTNPVVAHDLAAALELILWNIDLASLIDGGIQVGTGSSSLNIAINSATPTEIVADVQVIDTPAPAIALSIDLDGVFLTTSGSFQYSGNTLQVAGGISADMHASATLPLAVAADGTISVTVTNVTAVVGPLTPSFTGPDGNTLDGFITVGNNDFRTLVENLIQQQLIPTFTNKLPPLLESLLGATDQLLNNVTFTLDAQLGTPVTVTLNGTIGALEVVSGPAIGASPGHVTVHQAVAVATTATPIHGSSRGAARVSATPMLPPTDTAALDLVLSQDFLNALLHTLWNGGLLEGTATVGGLTANVSAKLSPFVIPIPDSSPCEIDGQRCDILLQLGQLEITLPDFQQTFAIDATAGARVEVDGTTVSLAVEQTPQLVVWQTGAPGRLTNDAVSEIVTSVVWPQLFGAIGDKLHITLPIPDLAALGLDSLSPNLANAQLQLDVHQQAAVTAGYLGLGADLELQTPHP